MSRRDELAAVIGEAAGLSLVESEWAANAVLAWLGEQLGDKGLLEATAGAMVHLRWPDDEPVQDGDREVAAVALSVVREWFGVAE